MQEESIIIINPQQDHTGTEPGHTCDNTAVSQGKPPTVTGSGSLGRGSDPPPFRLDAGAWPGLTASECGNPSYLVLTCSSVS